VEPLSVVESGLLSGSRRGVRESQWRERKKQRRIGRSTAFSGERDREEQKRGRGGEGGQGGRSESNCAWRREKESIMFFLRVF
jgi:hypothetical protein